MEWSGLRAAHFGRHRHRVDRPAGRLRLDRGGDARRVAWSRHRHDLVADPVGPARPADQSVRERSAAGVATLRHHGPTAGATAGRRRTLSHQHRAVAEARFSAAGLRHDAGRPARSDEWFGRRQRAWPLARGRAEADRRRRAGGDARCGDRGCRHARRAGAAVAGADPARRRHAVGTYHRGHNHRPQRYRVSIRRMCSMLRWCRQGFSFCCALRSPGSPGAERLRPRRANGRASARVVLAALSLFALIVLLGGVATGYFYAVEAAADGCLRFAVRRIDQRSVARARSQRNLTRRARHHRRLVFAADRGHDLHIDIARARHRPAGEQSGRGHPGRRHPRGRRSSSA